jgi:23S rRNA (uracil1939-C5)-methyltransferase
VADLFAGAGAFALRLARRARVAAFDASDEALAALARAHRDTPGLKPVATERHDLFRAPLAPSELAGFDAVVLDPPRQGAEAQIRSLAAARVPTVAYVSCAPATFARDARLLVDAGYRLESILPVDQFLWSAHLEKIAAFRLPAVNAASGGVLRRR